VKLSRLRRDFDYITTWRHGHELESPLTICRRGRDDVRATGPITRRCDKSQLGARNEPSLPTQRTGYRERRHPPDLEVNSTPNLANGKADRLPEKGWLA
jgi:hypothetical protein